MLTDCIDELPNPYKKDIREILASLVSQDYDYRRLTTELRTNQQDFEKKLEEIEFRCREWGLEICDQNVKDFPRHISLIDEVNKCYARRQDIIKRHRDDILCSARKCFFALDKKKSKFKSFHEKTVEHLKHTGMIAEDISVRIKCSKDINEMHRLFVKEVAFIAQCERDLWPLLQLIQGPDFKKFCNIESLKEYEWLPMGITKIRLDKTAELKETIGKTLKMAFAEMYIQKPSQPQEFLAEYLLNMQKTENLLEERKKLLNQFQEKPEQRKPPYPISSEQSSSMPFSCDCSSEI